MIFETLSIFMVILLGITSTLLMVVRSWRLRVIILALQYLGVFVLVGGSWPVEMAVAKLVAGWMASAILGMGMLGILAERSGCSRAAFHRNQRIVSPKYNPP